MITTMSRGNQDDRVESVEGRQVDQDEEVAEVEEVEEEEEMKMENVEGSENIGNESTKNVSSGDFSEVLSTQKRTSACLNIAQDIAQDSGNIAQALLIGVENDSKQTQTQQLTARGLIESVSTRANNIYTSIYKATCIPRLNIISTDTDDSISEVDNITKNEENSISVGNIYEASGVADITLGENNNVINNSTGSIIINDNNNNISGMEENTPGGGEQKIKIKIRIRIRIRFGRFVSSQFTNGDSSIKTTRRIRR
jgi:hypothetical protein